MENERKVELTYDCFGCMKSNVTGVFKMGKLLPMSNQRRHGGIQTRHSILLDTKCKCKHKSNIQLKVWEYPQGILNFIENDGSVELDEINLEVVAKKICKLENLHYVR